MNRYGQKIEVFSAMCKELSTLTTCKRMAVGCMIVSHDFTTIHSVGYNGWPHGFNHSNCQGDPCGCVHAEMNACIKLGRTCRNDNLCFVTHEPCYRCAQAIIQTAQIGKVFINKPTPHECPDGAALLHRAGIYIEWRDQ